MAERGARSKRYRRSDTLVRQLLMDTQTGCALFVKVLDRADMWRVRTSLSTIDGPRTSPIDCRCWRRTSFGGASTRSSCSVRLRRWQQPKHNDNSDYIMVPEDPVRLGLVTSLARPGGNMTGVNFFAAELASKRLELLRALVPTIKRVAVLLNPVEPTIAAANRRDVEAAAAAMGLEVRLLNASNSDEIDAAFATFVTSDPTRCLLAAAPILPIDVSNCSSCDALRYPCDSSDTFIR